MNLENLSSSLDELTPNFQKEELLAESFDLTRHALIVSNGRGLDVERLYKALLSISRDLVSLVDNKEMEPELKEGMMVGIKTSLDKIREKCNRELKDEALELLSNAKIETEELQKEVNRLYSNKQYSEVIWLLSSKLQDDEGAEDNTKSAAMAYEMVVDDFLPKYKGKKRALKKLNSVEPGEFSEELERCWDDFKSSLLKNGANYILDGQDVEGKKGSRPWKASLEGKLADVMSKSIADIISTYKEYASKDDAMQIDYGLKELDENISELAKNTVDALDASLVTVYEKIIEDFRPALTAQHYNFSVRDWRSDLENVIEDITRYHDLKEALSNEHARWEEFISRLRRFYELYAHAKQVGAQASLENMYEDIRHHPENVFGPSWDKLESLTDSIEDASARMEDIMSVLEMGDQLVIKFDITNLTEEEKEISNKILSYKAGLQNGTISPDGNIVDEINSLVSKLSKLYTIRVEEYQQQMAEFDNQAKKHEDVVQDSHLAELKKKLSSGQKANLSIYEQYITRISELMRQDTMKRDRAQKADLKEKIDELIVQYENLNKEYPLDDLSDAVYNLDENSSRMEDIEKLRAIIDAAVRERGKRKGVEDAVEAEANWDNNAPYGSTAPKEDEEIEAVFNMDVNETEVQAEPANESLREVPEVIVQGNDESNEDIKTFICSLCHSKVVGKDIFFCPHCGASYHERCARDVGFCPICGNDFQFTEGDGQNDAIPEEDSFFCPYCGYSMNGKQKICPNCGHDLSHL